MAEKLKHFFSAQVVRSIASDLHRAYPSFPERSFLDACVAKLDGLELTARGWHVAEVMRDHLPRPFAAAADVIVASLGPERDDSDEFGMEPFRYMPHVFYVQKYGLDDFETAMRAQYELTKRFSAESSIRAFLVKHPAATYARLVEWTRDDNVHVRRLVSEGTRPRLPWAPRLRAFQEDPRSVIALLERLKDDPERYVQRSVANNLNDIAKDHPELVVNVCRRWSTQASPGRTWIVKHALRTLLKKQHLGALELLGAGNKPDVEISRVRLAPRTVKLGGELRFSFDSSVSARPWTRRRFAGPPTSSISPNNSPAAFETSRSSKRRPASSPSCPAVVPTCSVKHRDRGCDRRSRSAASRPTAESTRRRWESGTSRADRKSVV